MEGVLIFAVGVVDVWKCCRVRQELDCKDRQCLNLRVQYERKKAGMLWKTGEVLFESGLVEVVDTTVTVGRDEVEFKSWSISRQQSRPLNSDQFIHPLISKQSVTLTILGFRLARSNS